MPRRKPGIGTLAVAARNRSFVCPPSVAMIVGTTPMIAIPVAVFMDPVAMIVGPTPQIRCNDFGYGRPMIAIPAADDCGSLHVAISYGRSHRHNKIRWLLSDSGVVRLVRVQALLL